jgi:hypothetical protein
MREKFLDQIRANLEYWLATDLSRPEFKAEIAKVGEARYRMDGLVFSILVLIDGGTGAMPPMDLIPTPHPDDEEFNRNRGANWWPSGVVINECQLHDLWSGRQG